MQSQSDWPGSRGQIMVTNSGDDTLSFLDPDTLEPLYARDRTRAGEREGPHHGAASPDGHFYYVGCPTWCRRRLRSARLARTGTVDDICSLRVRDKRGGRGSASTAARAMCAHAGRRFIWSHFDLASIFEASANGDDPRELRSTLAVIDAETMQTVAKIPLCPAAHGMGLAPDGSTAYVTCWGSDELAIVPLGDSPSSDAEVVRLPIEEGVGGDPTAPEFGPYAATVSPDGAEVWVSNLEGTSLRVYLVESGAFDETRRVDLTGSALFASFSAEGDRRTSDAGPAQWSVDTRTGETWPRSIRQRCCERPHGTLVLDGGERMGLVCEGNRVDPGTVVRLDLTAEGGPAIEEVFEVGVYPDDLIFIPEAQ